MASRDNHLLKSYIQSRESLNICVIMTNNKEKQNFKIVSELRKLPPYSPFLNIVEQAVSALKARA